MGVKRSHQSAMSSSVLRSATSSASNTVSSGQIARALASGRPIERPACTARSSRGVNQQRVVLLGDDDAWRFIQLFVCRFPSLRLMRSMGRRGSHRLRIRRRFAEEALITFPFHDPAADRAMTVTNELRVEHRRAPGGPRCRRRRMRRAHDPSCFRGRRPRLRGHPQEKRG